MFNSGKGLTAFWLAFVMLLLISGFAPALFSQDPPPDPKTTVEPTPDPNADITVDFVRKDIHVVMHYIGLRSGLNITVEGSITVELTVIYRKVKPKDAIKSICESNELIYIENGNFIYIKKRPELSPKQANVTKGTADGTYNVSFEQQELVAAIMETARVTNTPASLPSLTKALIDDWIGPLEELTAFIEKIQARKVSMYMRDARPEDIFARLAELGDLIRTGDAVKGYKFEYPKYKYRGTPAGGGGGPITEPSSDEEMVSKTYVVPGANVSALAGQLKNMLTKVGRIAFEANTFVLQVTDVKSRMAEVDLFMQEVMKANAEKQKLKPANDPLIVKAYNTGRDVTNEEFKSSLNSILSADGKVVTNPDQNSVIVYDHASQFKNIDLFFSLIDSEPQQVLLTSKLVEVSLDNFIGYGLQVFTEHGAQNLNNGRFSGSSFGTSASTVGQMFGQPTGFGPFVGTFVSDRINVTLQMLANDGKVQTLIMPQSLVSNKKTAKITVGQEVPYLQTSAATGGVAQVSVAFKEIATVMEVTPTILGDGLMRLDVRFTVKEQIGSIAIEQNDTPVLSNRESTTNVFVRDGETLVIGGLIRQRDRDQENGIPFLKDIPLLGYLFKSKNVRKERTDLMFFLRPTIVAHGEIGKRTGKGRGTECENRPMVWDDDDCIKMKLVGSALIKPGNLSKPGHFDPSKRPKDAKSVDPN